MKFKSLFSFPVKVKKICPYFQLARFHVYVGNLELELVRWHISHLLIISCAGSHPSSRVMRYSYDMLSSNLVSDNLHVNVMSAGGCIQPSLTVCAL